MTVSLRLQRRGQKKRPFYRIVAANQEAPRGGKYLEVVGTYNPMLNPAVFTLKEDRIKHWVSAGAYTTDIVKSLIKKQIPGLIEAKETVRVEKIQAKRKARKAKLEKAGKKLGNTKKKEKKAKKAPK